mgnify:FL=1
MSNPKDPDPNGLLAAMISYHEVLTNAMQAGFTRKEAFEMVRTLLQDQMRAAKYGGQ